MEECSVCHYRKETAIPHHWESEWSTNETHHWHQCLDEGYEHLKKDYGEHDMRYDQVASTDDLYIEKCSVCGYQKEVELDYDSTWSTSETHHWHQCVTSGFENKKKDYLPHDFVIDSELSDDYNTVEVCSTCGYVKTTPIEHNFDTNWSISATHHWHQCLDEGYEHLKKDYAEHTFNDDDHGGTITHTCTVCGYSYDEIYANTPIASSREMKTYYYDYQNNLQTMTSTVYFMNNTGDVPYVIFKDFYASHYGMFWNSLSATQTKVEDKVYRFATNGLGSIYINTKDDLIYITDATHFRTVLAVNTANGVTYITNGGEPSYVSFSSLTNQRVQRGAFSFDLGRYGVDIVLYDDVVYIPVQSFLDIFMSNNGESFAYNGKDVFDVSKFGSTLTGNVSDTSSLEYQYYHDSPWFQQSTRESHLAQFTYNEFCFSMDNFYGLREFRGVSSFNDYFVTNGYESDLKSTNSVTYELAMARFVGSWMYEGHAGYTRVSPYQQGNSNVQSTYSNNIASNNPRYSLSTNKTALTQLRNNAGKGIGLFFNGSTAIIRFDSFKKGRFWGTYTPDQFDYNTWHNNDTEMFFHKAFDEIGTHSEVENVVIDITLNGGGALNAIPWLEAYLTDDPFTLIRTSMTGEISEVHYSIDLDRNGTKGEVTDTYKGKYDFFLMTSNYSFSCGTAFPTFVKAGHMATIIGETSGGGSCAVGVMSTASGTVLRSSSIFQMGYFVGDTFVLNENGIEPDYTFSRNNFYNDAAINAFVNGL